MPCAQGWTADKGERGHFPAAALLSNALGKLGKQVWGIMGTRLFPI